MADKLQLMLEAERRGILPPDKVAVLGEARKRGLIGGGETFTKTGSFGMGMADMGSIGLDDEMRGFGRFLGSQARRLFTDEPGNSLDESVQSLRSEQKLAETDNPGWYAGGQVTGALVPALATGGRSIVSVAKDAPLIAKMGVGALQSAPAAAAYGFGSGEGLEDRLLTAGKYGLIAGGVGAALPAVVPAAKAVGSGFGAVKAGVTAQAPEAMDAVARKMSQEASDIFTKFRETGATLNKKKAVNIYNKMQKGVLSAGKTNAKLHGDTLSVLDDIRTAVKSGDPISLEEFHQFRQLLDDVISKNTDVAGKLNPDAFRAVKAKGALDDSIKTLKKIDIIGGKTESVDLLMQGMAKWSQKSKYETITRALKKADGDPAKIKANLLRLANDPKKTKGFTKEEISALKLAGNSTFGEKTLKGLGRFGIEPGNVFLPIVTGGLGAVAGGGPVTAALVGAGTVARQANKYVARGKADKLLKAIEAGK